MIIAQHLKNRRSYERRSRCPLERGLGRLDLAQPTRSQENPWERSTKLCWKSAKDNANLPTTRARLLAKRQAQILAGKANNLRDNQKSEVQLPETAKITGDTFLQAEP